MTHGRGKNWHMKPLLFDNDLSEEDPTWCPEMLEEPDTFASRAAGFVPLLKSSHGPGELGEERFEVIQDVRRELANWHRRIVLQGVGEDKKNLHSWVDVHNSGLPRCLLEIAADERIFDAEADEEYLHDVYSAVFACAAAYMRNMAHFRALFSDTAKVYLERLDWLFEKLWSMREPVLADLTEEEAHGWAMEHRLLSLAEIANSLYYKCYRRVRKLMAGKVHHVTMFLWVDIIDPIESLKVWKRLMEVLDTYQDDDEDEDVDEDQDDEEDDDEHDLGAYRPKGAGHSEIRRFANEVFVCNDIQADFVDSIGFILSTCSLDSISLWMLSGLWTFYSASGKLFADLPDDTYAMLREGCSKACQRQLCSGTLGESDDDVQAILLLTFWCTLFTIGKPLGTLWPDDLSSAQAKEIVEDFNRIKLLPLIDAFVQLPTPPEAIDRIEPLVFHLSWLLQIFYIALHRRIEDNPDGTDCPTDLADMKNTIRAVWYTTRTGIGRLIVERRAVRREWRSVLQVWNQIGQLCAVPTEPIEGYVRIRTHRDETSIQACAWVSCLCAEWPVHVVKEVCEGCQKAVYCSSRCQKKDWEYGHKDVCTRQNANSS